MPPEHGVSPKIDPKHWAVILHLPQEFGYEVVLKFKNGYMVACFITEIDYATLGLKCVRTVDMCPVEFGIEHIEEVLIRSGRG